MMPMLVDLMGYAAAGLTTLSFVPQVLHTLRTRDVSGISLGMYACFTAGIALWLAYGLLLRAWPLVLANSVTLALASTILVLKLSLGRAAADAAGPDQGRAEPGPEGAQKL